MQVYCYTLDMAGDQTRSASTLSFGKVLRLYRRRNGLTQAEVGEALKVDQTTVSVWERAAEAPRDWEFYAEAMAQLFGVDPSMLEPETISHISPAIIDDWQISDIRRHAPNTPIAEAEEVLTAYDHLDAAGRKAARAMLNGLRAARAQAPKTIQETSADYGEEVSEG